MGLGREKLWKALINYTGYVLYKNQGEIIIIVTSHNLESWHDLHLTSGH